MNALYFYRTTCIPCRTVGPMVEKWAKDNGLKLEKVNADEYPALANVYRVQTVPTVVLMDNKRPVGSRAGNITRQALDSMLEVKRG